ncbi:hypothetical protein [Dethiosulfatarculus sandiegensis]|uniref:Uncharacterized protein n=1 Tax=Dethiosulfatarculus sandiegensis TaxID=1429043 RepID=A0A0D2HKL1_9BACT|nr:hypothetical protein [Dethiosulfatarculus sandiegensis]KIX11193.1 hypothetical protein X474_25205 [Dethiosulfatarculus sandiegensis]
MRKNDFGRGPLRGFTLDEKRTQDIEEVTGRLRTLPQRILRETPRPGPKMTSQGADGPEISVTKPVCDHY